MGRVSANFKHALILAESRLGLLPVIFHKFMTELWPLIDVLQLNKCFIGLHQFEKIHIKLIFYISE